MLRKKSVAELEDALVKRLQSDFDFFLREESFESPRQVSSLDFSSTAKQSFVWRRVAVVVSLFAGLSVLAYSYSRFDSFMVNRNDVVESNSFVDGSELSKRDFQRNSLIFSTEDVVGYSKNTISLIEENVESAFMTPVSFQFLRERADDEPDAEDEEENFLDQAYYAIYSDSSLLRIDPLIRSIGVILTSREAEPSLD